MHKFISMTNIKQIDTMNDENILIVDNVSVSYTVDGKTNSILDSISFSIKQGEIVALVGESGCGKSITAQTILRLLPYPYGEITSGSVLFKKKDILKIPLSQLYTIRGKEIGIIFQDSFSALDPLLSVKKQIEEVYKIHCKSSMKKKDYKHAVIEILKTVGFIDPIQVMHAYPHELSGGMQQRVMIAIALAASPSLLIADEPTTSLDIVTQMYIIQLLKEIQYEKNISVLFITHDMHIVNKIADSVVVMYAGQVVESGKTDEVLAEPLHPYTRALLEVMHPDIRTSKRFPVITCISEMNLLQSDNFCRFLSRCSIAQDRCACEKPELIKKSNTHFVRCFYAGRK
ncbi:MAG TPA: ABC transporter ATP-binding protein [Spirochaetales bacterium]|nr:ABC transporter ATP-binding protein [Spirochaetales bacterium]HQK34175.1 ABC transporter ATP-binding protein [Spirochaetales bacterium]